MSNTPEQPNFKDVMERLRHDLDVLIMESIHEPVAAAIAQIPAIMQRSDLSEETKIEMLEELQISLVAPVIGALVYTALGVNMNLPTLLYNLGQGWEEIRSKHMAQAAQEILNRTDAPKEASKENDEETTR